MFNVGCLPCCFGVRGGACVQADVPRAQLSSGTILGEYVGGSEHFSAVPFAAPPVGIRRWKKPEPVEPWPGELDCSSRRPPDDRRGRPVQSVDPEHDRQPTEDCLHLDIWLPMGTLGSLSRSPKGLPVLVWIYGGGLLSGSKDDPGSSGQCYAEPGIIFICINYRVGALGFLCPRHGDPNCGLWDQACALQWIQNEIGNLGGDPKKVTIMGQSAGGDSVYWLCASPVANKLFSRAIMMSPASFTITLEQAAELAEEFAANASADTADLADMQKLPVEAILEAQTAGTYRVFPTMGPGWRELMFSGTLPPVDPEPDPSSAGLFRLPEGHEVRGWPMPVAVVDGEFLQEPPLKALASGVARHLDIIVGGNKQENGFRAFSEEEPERGCDGSCGRYVSPDEPREEMVQRLAWEIAGCPALLKTPFKDVKNVIDAKVLPAYEEELGEGKSSPQLLNDAIASDFSFLAKVHLISQRLSKSRCSRSLFRYQFDGYRGCDAFHGSELPLLLGVPDDGVTRIGSMEIREKWMHSWINFVCSGDPNTEEMKGAWKQFTESCSDIMIWDGLEGWRVDRDLVQRRRGLVATAELWEKLWLIEGPGKCQIF